MSLAKRRGRDSAVSVSVLGSGNRKAVEICAGQGIECNSANLIINHGWQGLLVDGDEANIEVGRKFYEEHPNTRYSAPTLVASWVDAENIDDLITQYGFNGDIGLLSVDVDGNDYWIWKAITCASPRVVVIEFNPHLGPLDALTLPYDPNFKLDFSREPFQCGASLPALVKLARQKGYRLVGVHSLGFNAFFVRNDLGVDLVLEKTAQECFTGTERLSGHGPSSLQAMYRDDQKWEEV